MTLEQTTNRLIVVAVSTRGAEVAINGDLRTIAWPDLRESADQDDAELRSIYSALLSQAVEMAKAQNPVTVFAARDYSKIYYFVYGRGIDGLDRRIRAYRSLRFRSDEGMEHYRMSHAKTEASEIRRRNGINA